MSSIIVKGKVCSINDNGTAVVIAGKPSACAHNCAECSSCEMEKFQVVVGGGHLCRVGDIVLCEVNEAVPWRSLFIAYLIPVFIAVAACIGYACTNNGRLIFSLAATAIGFYLLFAFMRSAKKSLVQNKQGEIINIIEKAS